MVGGGGGGGGGLITGYGDQFSFFLPGDSVLVTVGNGGQLGSSSGGTQGPGSWTSGGRNSAFAGLVAIGGGGHANCCDYGGGGPNNGGSGAGIDQRNCCGGPGGFSVNNPRQGFDGGSSMDYNGGGGGGANGAGISVPVGKLKSGAGGPGLLVNITGEDLYWAGGGGGVCNSVRLRVPK